MLTAIEKIKDKSERIIGGNDSVKPGQPVRISEAAAPGDYVRQGDLYLIVCGTIPSSLEPVEPLNDQDRQLVPGTTQGSRHCLDSLDGVEMYRPAGWGPGWEQVEGPVFVATEERTVTHPTHGDVTIPADMVIVCRYQREWDVEQARERRNAD